MPLHHEVFAQQIWGFLCNDIDSCLMVSKDMQELGARSKFKGGLNFPAASTMLAVIDLVASYHLGKEATTTDIAKFVAKYFGPHAPKLADEKIAKGWYEVFRHGLAHQFSPKAGGVAMDFTIPEVFVFISPGAEKIPSLIVPELFAVFKKALRAYESDLDASPSLQQNFQKRYDALLKEDFKAMRKLRTLCGE